MRQVRNGCGVPQVHVDPQKGSTRGARLFVRGGVCPLDAPAQGLLLCAPARACGRFWPGARGYLGAPRAPVGACRRCGGHRVTFSAESAGVWEVVGRRPRVEMAEPEVVPPLSEGVPDLQQAGVDAAPVVLAKRLPLDLLPSRAGVPLGGLAMYTWRPVRWGVSASHWHPFAVPLWRRASGVPSATASHPTRSPSQPSSSWRSAAAMPVESMRSKGPWVSPSRDRASSYTPPQL